MKLKLGLKLTLILCSGFLLFRLFPLERTINLGREDNWQDLTTLTNVFITEGKWGFQDILLQDAETQITATTDLLLHFNQLPFTDETRNYTLLSANPMDCSRVKIFGQASGAFQDRRHTLELSPGNSALFQPGTLWDDFSLEFWLHPLTLTNGESLLIWHGALLQQGQVRQQRLSCTITNRKLNWQFDNFFHNPEGNETRFHLQSLTAMLPGRWYHHQLRFTGATGLLEYLINGEPEAIIYTTATGEEDSTVYLPLIGRIAPGNVVICRNYTGFLDELKLSGDFNPEPALFKYPATPGRITSRVFDLEYSGTAIKKIDAVFATPGSTEIYFYYKTANQLYSQHTLTTDWIQFLPGLPLKEPARGKYFQLMMELYPDGSRNLSPALSQISFTYEPDLPPSPPSHLSATAGANSVLLQWNRVHEYDIGGYLIYYGEHPGVYNGNNSREGASPIDAGDANQFTLTGLDNGKLYYFTVVAYDASDPPHYSLFAREVSARPSVLYK